MYALVLFNICVRNIFFLSIYTVVINEKLYGKKEGKRNENWILYSLFTLLYGLMG